MLYLQKLISGESLNSKKAELLLKVQKNMYKQQGFLANALSLNSLRFFQFKFGTEYKK